MSPLSRPRHRRSRRGRGHSSSPWACPYATLVAQARRLCGHTVLVPSPVGLHPDGTPAFRWVQGVVTSVADDGSVCVMFFEPGRRRKQHFGVSFALQQFRVLSF
ncbi:MAG: hypothetical protein IRZ31_12900 [Thermogemmatispora sp.]|uniref:hypothetical protein n=1 Tax=Thermogemmatispora sp. TaxID=1968838 RepID=UPI00262F7B5D|nr:hypothetical protein [Thermogemmatispora sp.]MBX5457792.1 hypothetical protein [Thermogemmatispora sp.]